MPVVSMLMALFDGLRWCSAFTLPAPSMALAVPARMHELDALHARHSPPLLYQEYCPALHATLSVAGFHSALSRPTPSQSAAALSALNGVTLAVPGCECRPAARAALACSANATVSSALAGAFARLAVLDWAWLIVLRSPLSAAHAPPRDGALQMLRALIALEVRRRLTTCA